MRVVQVPFSYFLPLWAAIKGVLALAILGAIVFMSLGSGFYDENGWALLLGLFLAPLWLAVYFTPTVIATNVNRSFDDSDLDTPNQAALFIVLKPIILRLVWPLLWVYVWTRSKFNSEYDLDFLDFDEASNRPDHSPRIEVFGTDEKIQHPHLLWIFLLNLFFAGTLVLWVVAFYWAMNPGRVEINDNQGNDFPKVQKPTADNSVADRLSKLNEMFDQGIISGQDLDREKKRILKEL
jgi:hypothetical protein